MHILNYANFYSLTFVLLFAAICVDGKGNVTALELGLKKGRPWGIPWDLPDWSYAGYGAGKGRSSPSSRLFNVVSFGASRAGNRDASAAIQEAIYAAASAGGGTVYLPAGRYLLTKPLRITRSKVVLKGAGWDKTILSVPKPLSAVMRNKRGLEQTPYSWAGGFIQIGGVIELSKGDTRLARVVENKSRGFTTLKVDSASSIHKGDWVRLLQSDPKKGPRKGSLASTLYGGYVVKTACGNKCLKGMVGNEDLVRWAARVKKVEGNFVTLDRDLPIDVRPEWSAELHSFPEVAYPHDCGVMDLKISFPLSRMRPHLQEVGYNGVAVENAFNAWVRNVKVANADNAFIVRFSHYVTIDNVEVYATGRRGKYEEFGHIGVGLYNSADVVVSRFNIKSPMLHDTTVRGTMMCVFHNGRGSNLNIDSHRAAPYGTLYSNIYLGKGNRAFTSGGDGLNGLPAAAYTTYWNIRRSNGKAIYIPNKTQFGSCTYGALLTFMGRFSGTRCESYHVTQTSRPRPSDLFAAQVKSRLARV